MKKSDRAKIFNKFNGKCAYCGCELTKGWHVDHLKPVRRFDGQMGNPENDCLENCMPACASCNINKHSNSIEGFRNLIEGFITSLNRYSVQYKVAKRFGLIEEVDKPIVFYFEQMSPEAQEAESKTVTAEEAALGFINKLTFFDLTVIPHFMDGVRFGSNWQTEKVIQILTAEMDWLEINGLNSEADAISKMLEKIKGEMK